MCLSCCECCFADFNLFQIYIDGRQAFQHVMWSVVPASFLGLAAANQISVSETVQTPIYSKLQCLNDPAAMRLWVARPASTLYTTSH